MTDIGDAAAIASDSGATVPPNKPEELASASKSALQKNQGIADKTATVTRDSIVERYSPDQIARMILQAVIES